MITRDIEIRRLGEITINQLLYHLGGWDRDVSFDPMLRAREIAKILGKSSPASSMDVINYMLDQPLQYSPGTKYAYSNFGYNLLGRVIEKASGKSYINFIQDDILSPLGIRDIQLGRTLPEYRAAREVKTYDDPFIGESVFRSGVMVPMPDGGFYLEAMDSHGGLIASAPDLVLFANKFGKHGDPLKIGEHKNETQEGSLPGTTSTLIWRANGVVIAAIVNKRRDSSSEQPYTLTKILDDANDAMRW